ncbi:family 78 glycoside hydrolase catalytic domain [Paenibacillus sp. FSL R10-2771]|uniref:family 78 glycoside hydrolase catalytic domain n=1 Tax=Paenibacillus sp. FSL R10-2771 TaxID=2954693 RepID=UPI0030F60285
MLQPESNVAHEHILVYFRRTFFIADGEKPSLKLDVTADSRYQLYVNGQRAEVGPCKPTRQAQYYDSVEVTPFLRTGTNVLAVKVLRYPSSEPFQYGEGGPTSVWRSQSAGLLVEGSVCNEEGDLLESLDTDSSWKVFRHKGYHNRPSSLIMWMGGLEEVDGSGAPSDWTKPEFDDHSWSAACEFAETRGYGLLNPWQLLPRPIPFLYEEERNFVAVTRVEQIEIPQAEGLLHSPVKGSLFLQPGQSIAMELDAGELTTGYLYISVHGGRGSEIRLLCAEGYEAQESQERNRIKGNREDTSGKLLGDYDVYHVAGTGEAGDEAEHYEPFWFRTFRYVRVEIEAGNEPLELISIAYRETGYPLDVQSTFHSSDAGLNKLWDLSVRTLRRCMHETYEDCPYYEQLQYTMDSRLMMLYTYYVSADERMPRRTIADFYQSRMPSGLLQSRYPSTDPQVIPSFSLYWIDMLAEYYKHTGDWKLIIRYRPAMLELLNWFNDRLTAEGIVGVTSNRYWTYFDWVNDWPMGSPPESAEHPMILLSLMYAAALRKSSTLFRVTGWREVAGELEMRAESICKAVNKLAWSEEKQLYRELPGTEIYSQHSQIMAVLAGAITGADARGLLQRALREPIHRVTLPFTYLLMQALKQVGLHEELFGLWDRWRIFEQQGLSTLPETEVNSRSDCHAWSAVPLAEFPASLLGITPAEPGYAAIRIAPVIGNLTSASGSVITVQGIVHVEWKLEAGEFKIIARTPDSVPAVIVLPDGSEYSFRNKATFTVAIN